MKSATVCQRMPADRERAERVVRGVNAFLKRRRQHVWTLIPHCHFRIDPAAVAQLLATDPQLHASVGWFLEERSGHRHGRDAADIYDAYLGGEKWAAEAVDRLRRYLKALPWDVLDGVRVGNAHAAYDELSVMLGGREPSMDVLKRVVLSKEDRAAIVETVTDLAPPYSAYRTTFRAGATTTYPLIIVQKMVEVLLFAFMALGCGLAGVVVPGCCVETAQGAQWDGLALSDIQGFAASASLASRASRASLASRASRASLASTASRASLASRASRASRASLASTASRASSTASLEPIEPTAPIAPSVDPRRLRFHLLSAMCFGVEMETLTERLCSDEGRRRAERTFVGCINATAQRRSEPRRAPPAMRLVSMWDTAFDSPGFGESIADGDAIALPSPAWVHVGSKVGSRVGSSSSRKSGDTDECQTVSECQAKLATVNDALARCESALFGAYMKKGGGGRGMQKGGAKTWRLTNDPYSRGCALLVSPVLAMNVASPGAGGMTGLQVIDAFVGDVVRRCVRNLVSDSPAGLHVHVSCDAGSSANGLLAVGSPVGASIFHSVAFVLAMKLTWASLEQSLFRLEGFSEDDDFCKRIDWDHTVAALSYYTKRVRGLLFTDVRSLPDDKHRDMLLGDKYRTLNFRELLDHNAIEARLHRGTSDPVRVAAWSTLVVLMTTEVMAQLIEAHDAGDAGAYLQRLHLVASQRLHLVASQRMPQQQQEEDDALFREYVRSPTLRSYFTGMGKGKGRRRSGATLSAEAIAEYMASS